MKMISILQMKVASQIVMFYVQAALKKKSDTIKKQPPKNHMTHPYVWAT